MFTPDDLNELKRFKAITNQGDYKIKGEAAIMVANSFMWLNSLEIKINEAIESQGKLSNKIMKNPIKKVGK